MADEKRPAVPAGLGSRARKFWRSTVEDYDLSDVELLLLTELCRTIDEIDALQAAIEIDGVMVPGSKGQTRPHPAFSQIRASRSLISRLASQLDLEDPNGDTLASPLTARGRQAARKRWAAAPPSLRALKGGSSGTA